MATINVSIVSYSFYLTGIKISDVTYPFLVCRVKFDKEISTRDFYRFTVTAELKKAAGEYLFKYPVMLGLTWGNKYNDEYSKYQTPLSFGGSDGFSIKRIYGSTGSGIWLYYNNKSVSYADNYGLNANQYDYFSISSGIIFVDDTSGVLLYTPQEFSGGAGPNIRQGMSNQGFPAFPFTILFNSNSMAYGLFTSSIEILDLRDSETVVSPFLGVPGPPPVEPIPPSPPYNPYEPGGLSGPTQSDDPSAPGYLPPGTFDDTSDPIPDSSLPTLSAANTGFTRIYNPTLSQVQDLARYLWTDETVIQTIWNKIKQYFEDPMQAIIGFNLVPVPVPDGGSQNFALMFIDTGVSMNVAASQFVDVDCGTVELDRYYGSALDQSPYTKVSCFLPYIGTVHLNTDEVMGTTLQVKYRVDIVSGSCVAKILVDGNVLYQYSGHCAITIPFASADFSSYVSAAITVAKMSIGLGIAAVTGMPVLPSPGSPAQTTNDVTTTTRTETETVRNPSTGRQITSGTRTSVETVETPYHQSATRASLGYLSPANVSNTVGEVMGSKPTIERSGSFSGNTGYLGVRRPFLIIERPNMCLPENYQHLNGYPTMITMELSTCKGFTRIQQVELTGLTATNPEQAEILGLLKSGVFFDV